MRKWSLAVGVAAAAAILTVPGCSKSSSNQANTTTSTTASTSTSISTSTSSSQPHNQADVAFAQQMIRHHQQAIQMSDIILGKQGIDPRVVDLANQIKATQSAEIQQMQGWLSQWGEPTPSVSVSASVTTSSSGPVPSETPTPGPAAPPGASTTAPGAAQMPGMVSEQEITALENAEGADAGKLFLTMMIHHHQGAIAMAQTEVQSGQNPPAIAMAQSIITSQQQQITTMQNLLATL